MPLNPPPQPSSFGWMISSWICGKRISNRIANTLRKLRTNRIMNKPALLNKVPLNLENISKPLRHSRGAYSLPKRMAKINAHLICVNQEPLAVWLFREGGQVSLAFLIFPPFPFLYLRVFFGHSLCNLHKEWPETSGNSTWLSNWSLALFVFSAESACFKGLKMSCDVIMFSVLEGKLWPEKLSHHLMGASCWFLCWQRGEEPTTWWKGSMGDEATRRCSACCLWQCLAECLGSHDHVVTLLVCNTQTHPPTEIIT